MGDPEPVFGLIQPMLIFLIDLVQKSTSEEVNDGSHDHEEVRHRTQERRRRNSRGARHAAAGGGRSGVRHDADHVANDLHRFYALAYGLVYATVLVVQLLPQDNPVMHGFHDGGKAAIDELSRS